MVSTTLKNKEASKAKMKTTIVVMMTSCLPDQETFSASDFTSPINENILFKGFIKQQQIKDNNPR
jgi:hypothetical protein